MANVLSTVAGIRRSTRALAARVALGLVASAGHAAPETEPIRIEYAAPPGCPDASGFSGAVFERTSKARPASDNEPARTFVVVIESSGTQAQGSLVVREDGMSTVARQVSGKDCHEVARALSLATALAIDPEASLVAPDPSGTGGTGGTDAGSAPQPSTGQSEPPRAEQQDAADTLSAPSSPLPASAGERRAALLAGASAAFGPAPNPGFGASAAIEWSSPSPVVLPSAVGIELVFLTSAEHAVAGAGSSFDFAFARPYVCTLGLALGSDAGLMPCVGAALGAVVGSGSRIARPATETRFWAAGELALRLDIALSDDWFANASGGASLPFSRYRFLFRTPDTRIYRVPALTAVAGLRLGLRL